MIDQKAIEVFNELLANRYKYHLPQFNIDNNEDGESFRHFHHPEFPENIFLQEAWVKNSYGERELSTIRLVEGKQKLITTYEPF